jgi:hypothetical protein
VGGEERWPRIFGRRCPRRRGLKGKGVFLPLEDSPGAHTRSDLSSGPVGRAAVSSGARTGAAGQARAGSVEEKV